MVFDHQNTTFIITREDLDFGPVTLVTEAVTIGRKREADIVLDDPSVAIYAGPRRGELLELAWSNVDFGLNLINFTETKTNRDRAVPMESIVREALFELRKQNGNAEYVLQILTPKRGTRMLRGLSQQRAERRVLPTSRFTIYVTHSALA